jgi:glycosyltransferase involved in cell wall biosynthesis
MQTRPLRVLVKTPFSQYSGYGMDGFGLVRALHEWGCDVYPQPTWVDVPIPRDLLPLFGKTLIGPFDLTINHWDPAHLFITREAREMTRVAVAWTMWEFSGGPGKSGEGPVSGLVPHCEMLEDEEEDKNGKKTLGLKSRLQWFDMVLGYDQVSIDALQPYVPEQVKLGILQGGYDHRQWHRAERDWFGDRFQFIMHGALNARKQPWLAIEAFQALKFEKPEEFAGARLALHTSAPGTLFPELNVPFEEHGIRVFVDSLDKPALDQFYAAGHCLLAPSRGEGKNLPALEFMTTGGVVAATDYGGHKQWLSGDWAYPLYYTLMPTFADKPWAAHDARVPLEHLKETMWHIYTHRAEAKKKAELAQQMIPKICDWPVVLEGLFTRIKDEVTGPGPAIYDQAMACRRTEEEDVKAGILAPDGWHRG